MERADTAEGRRPDGELQVFNINIYGGRERIINELGFRIQQNIHRFPCDIDIAIFAFNFKICADFLNLIFKVDTLCK